MRCLQSLLLLILTACMLFVCKVKAIVCAGNDDRSLDLSKLYWSDGSYGGENDVVTVKLCGDTSHDYEIKLKNGTVIGKTYNRTSPTAHGETMLTFTANGGYKTFLYFACEKNTLGVPILLDSYNKTYFLEWKSLIACKDLPTVDLMPCYVYTSTQQLIDLSPLTKTTGYYEIPTTGGRQLRVNVCGHIGDANCRNNSVCSAAEGADFKNVSKMEKSTKLAFINKTVQLRYSKASGDDGCDTLINFICPASPQQASGPEVKSSCSDDKTQPWVIDWHTTHACVSSHLSSNNCTLNNPQYGVDVDLSPLRNDGRPFSVVEGVYTYRIGLCGTTVTDCPLKPSDNGTRGYTVACQSKGGDKTSIGKSKFTQLKYFDDVLVMRLFKGTPCGNHVQRETIIHFHCNKTAGVGHPTYQSETHCSYHFDWNTTYACPSCKYVDTNNTFDFSRLTSAADSSSWTTSTANNAIAYVNVCAGLSGVSGCDSNAGICVKTPGKSHGTSWGDAGTMAFGKVGHTIILSYTNGDVCDENTGERHETSIYFGCSNTESRGPQWRNEPSSTCKHSFIWFTSAACSHNSSTSSDCKVTSKDYTYDFFNITQIHNGTLQLNGCGNLPDDVCGQGATACDGKKVISNKVPSLVVENDVLVTTTYEPAGDKHLKVRYNCDHMAEVANVTAVQKHDNQITVDVSTTVSCAPKAIDCNPSGADGRTYDLSGLRNINWEAESSDGMKYYFSICSPLDRSKPDVAQCPGGPISSCQETTDGHKVNLGYAASNPEVSSTGTIRFHYINGERCKHGNGTPRQTTVTLNCKDVETTPRMTGEDSNCNYEIWWDTPKACPLEKAVTTECGVIKDDIRYDLSSLNNTRTAADTEGNLFYLAVCTNVSVVNTSDSCKGAAVCVKRDSTFKNVGNHCVAAAAAAVWFAQQGETGMDSSNDTLLTAMQSEWGTVAVFTFAVLLGVFIVIAAIGNLMVMVAILVSRRHCDRGYIFIYNLSLVDFLTAVCVMPLSLVTLLKGEFIFSDAVCQFNGFSVQVLFITSIHTLMYMAVYRFMSISSPFTPISLYKIGLMVVASWLWALIVSSLSMDVLSSFLYKPYTTQCGPTYPTDTYGWVNVAIVAGACFIVPLGVIICIYVLIFRKANRLFSRLVDPNYTNYSHEAHVEQRRLSITFIIIVVGFIICWSPIFIYLNYASLVKDKTSIPTTINPIVYWFSYLNSAINPFIYGLRTPIFKRLQETMFGCHDDKRDIALTSSNQSLSKSMQNSAVSQSKPAREDVEATAASGDDLGLSKSSLLAAKDCNSKGMQIEADDGHIKLTYNTAAGNTSVITFLCNKDGPDGEVSFLWTDPVTRTHYFQWKTSLVCSPLEKECTRRTNGAEYDFSSLIRHDTNYLAHKYSGELYYINICYRVLATGPARHCPVGAAVCMASGPAENRTYHSLGRLGADNPIKALGGAVYIQYLDGETCPSNHSKKLTSLIMMRCNQNRQVVGEVEAAGSSENCRQDFILETSAACPVAASTTTVKPSAKSCTTIAGLNMDTLKKQYKVESPHHTYYVNFCGATGGDLPSCDGQASFGVCQVSKDSSQEQVLAGKPTSSAVEVEGRIVFNFTDGKACAHGPTGSKRNVVLTLHCDQFVGRDSTPQFYGEDSADCTYHMGWGRPELCSPEKVTCSVNHNGHIVDLSALSDEMHFGIPTGDLASKYEGKNYLVSVCKPLSPSPLNKCPGAAICETSSAGSQAIGYVHSSPRVIDGDKKNWGIELVYNTTKPCDSKYPGSTISSIIKFTCGGYKGAPDLIDTDGCTYTFLWRTSEACDEDANSQVPGKCEIKNSKTDDIIDLSPLKGETFQVDNYKMAVCGSLPSGDRGSCNDDAAVCINGNTSAGKYSTMQLNKHGDNIVLQYSNGSSCRGSDGAGTITTMIEFVCDPKAGKGQPSLELKFDSCVNSFRWKTAYVCAADCTFDYMGQLYDFRHLSPHRQPYSLSSQGYKFEMDICRNIPASVAGTEATCISVEKDGKKYPIAYTSSLVPHYWGEGRLALTYVGTENEHICPSPGQQASTLVKLTCHNSLGKPSFVSLASNCTFIFEWKTYVACRDNTRVKVDVVDGVFTDPASSFIFNINQHLNHMVEVSESEYTYAISINNPLHEHCGDGSTHVCQYKPSFSRSIGKNIDSYYYQDEELQLVLNSTSTCGRLTSSNVQTVINFLCNDKAPNDSSPAFIDETHSCRYLFEWETPALCRPAAATTGGKHGLPGGAIAGIVIAVLVCVVIAIVIVYKVKRRRRWDGTYEYSGLSTDDDTTMLVSANKGSTPRYYDDDDELII